MPPIVIRKTSSVSAEQLNQGLATRPTITQFNEALAIRPTTAQVQTQVQAAVTATIISAGGSVELIPFTPAAIASRLLWFDASDAATLTLDTNQVTAWRSKGNTAVTLTPLTVAPKIADSPAVRFDSTILASSAGVSLPTSWLLMAVVENIDFTDFMYLFSMQDYIMVLGTQAGLAYGFAKQNYQTQAQQAPKIGPGVHMIILSYDEETKLLRLSIDDQPGYAVTPEPRPLVLADVQFVLGGSRQSNGQVDGPLQGDIREVLFLDTTSMPLIRKLQGYGRVHYNVPLGPNHPYATVAPFLQDLEEPDLTPQLF